jgi:hypothetical protein
MIASFLKWIASFFGGGRMLQVGKGNQAFTGSSSGDHSPVLTAGRDVNYVYQGDGPKTHSEKERLLEWLHANAFREPLSHVLPNLMHLAHLVGNNAVERWARLELFGYTTEGQMQETDTVPEYRTVVGQYFDQFNRALRVPSDMQFVTSDRLRFGAAMLETFAQQTDMQNIAVPDMLDLIRESFSFDAIRFCFNPVSIAEIVSSIRNHTLDKIRELEQGHLALKEPEPKPLSRKARTLLVKITKDPSYALSVWTTIGDRKRLMQTAGKRIYPEATNLVTVADWYHAFDELRSYLGVPNGSDYFLNTEGRKLAEQIKNREPELALSDEAIELLTSAVADPCGSISKVRTTGGFSISANNRNFINSHDPALISLWQAAFDELLGANSIADDGSHHVFNVTQKGRDIAKSLSSDSAP